MEEGYPLSTLPVPLPLSHLVAKGWTSAGIFGSYDTGVRSPQVHGPDPVTQGSRQAKIPGPRHLLYQDLVRRRPPTMMSAKEAGVFPLNPLPQAWRIWDTQELSVLPPAFPPGTPSLARVRGLPVTPNSIILTQWEEENHIKRRNPDR